MTTPTFIIDCPYCKAKVAAIQSGLGERGYFDHELGEPYGHRLYVGSCPVCSTLLAGESTQIAFEDHGAEEDAWSDVIRVYPKPYRTFTSFRIPRSVIESLKEADRSLQANANTAACVMFGRALEAACRDILIPSPIGNPPVPPTQSAPNPEKPERKIMLAEGIQKLKDNGTIDDRLYDWSQHLRAFRNLAAHPDEISISREDAEDLQTFVYAIIEYIYDLTDRYNEFKIRLVKRTKHTGA